MYFLASKSHSSGCLTHTVALSLAALSGLACLSRLHSALAYSVANTKDVSGAR
jgi:hypothetical protein